MRSSELDIKLVFVTFLEALLRDSIISAIDREHFNVSCEDKEQNVAKLAFSFQDERRPYVERKWYVRSV